MDKTDVVYIYIYIYIYIYTYTYTHTHIRTMGYYSAIKKNEIMPFAATCMDLEIIILSKVRKRNTNTISLICGI